MEGAKKAPSSIRDNLMNEIILYLLTGELHQYAQKKKNGPQRPKNIQPDSEKNKKIKYQFSPKKGR